VRISGNVSTTWSIVGTGDFNGDGKDDILWRHTSGDTVIWFTNGFPHLSDTDLGNVSTDWSGSSQVSQYTVAVSASPSADGTVSGGGTFSAASSQTVTATASSLLRLQSRGKPREGF